MFPLLLHYTLEVQPVSGLLWTLLLLFAWYCYRVGADLPLPGLSHVGKSSSWRARPSGAGSITESECSTLSKAARSHQAMPCITMETKKEEEQGRGYLSLVLSHTFFPAQTSASHRKLYAALQEYAKRYSWVGMGRIHKGLREQVQLNDRSTIQRPHLLFLPDVPSIPFFPQDAHRHDIEVLETNYPVIRSEFWAVYQRGTDSKFGWNFLGAKGQAVFPLYSRGRRVGANCRSCPCTYRTLLSLRTFINSNSLGAAGFWVLWPGTTISGSYGATNTRLRCHLGLQTLPQCELVVGGEPQCWSDGHCLLLDDSFLHSVSHKGLPEDLPRVIFNVDLWHPNVAAAERQALDFIFCPDQ
ncbi:aspartate beta-hydroxylase domain-containing protein 2 [Aplochiton taeniatus]